VGRKAILLTLPLLLSGPALAQAPPDTVPPPAVPGPSAPADQEEEVLTARPVPSADIPPGDTLFRRGGSDYKVGRQDLLEIKVFDLDELNQTVRVADDGGITLPFLGRIEVAGMTRSELEQQIAGMTAERDDLVAAIGRLRQGIQSLNREGRERFLVAFEQVSGHFQQLFTKLFGGGKAELRLTESEDPLEAGLEIHASPPGKKLQVMSLLSGGEQALTALSLLFAVFMTNPAPICVLDEVDAPLDDSNVERYCDLLRDMAGSTDTRFLVITHSPITMARMDRLFGVTMAERGVSQLVSVDLEAAERFLEAS